MARIIILLLIFCNSNWSIAKSTVFKNVKDLKILKHQVVIEKPAIGTTLIIFDIDDTLLEANNFVGSSKWYNWQRGKVVTDLNGKEFTIKKENKFSCIFRTLTTTFEIMSTRPTQPDITEIISELGSYNLMLLTARSPKHRSATERELKANRIAFDSQHLASSTKIFDFIFNDGKRSAKVTYQNGMVMASGLNKGLVLETMLKRLNKDYQHIYFVDDSPKNIRDMDNVWKDKTVQMNIFHYTKVDKSISEVEIEQSVFAKAHFEQFISTTYPDSYKAFRQDRCH